MSLNYSSDGRLNLLPAPMVGTEVNLKSFEFMPLKVDQLKHSKSWLRCKRRPELAFYLINLWSSAWFSIPAASLEDDDDVLADAAMCPPDVWEKVKQECMQGWVLCSDGRWYHPVVAELASAAWARKGERQQKRDIDAARKREERRQEREARISSGILPKKPGPKPKSDSNIITRPTDGFIKRVESREKIEDIGSLAATADNTPPHASTRTRETAIKASRPDDVSLEAKQLTDQFEKLRTSLWPNESSFPAPTLTLWHQAELIVREGAPAELVVEHMERVARRQLERGERAPKDFGFCNLSLNTAIRRHREAAAGQADTARVVAFAPPSLAPETEEDATRRNLRAWFQRGIWIPAWGDPPGSKYCTIPKAIIAECSGLYGPKAGAASP